MKPQQHAFAAVGQAVLSCQLLELAIIPIYEFFKMSTDSEYLKKTGGLFKLTKLKLPLRNLLNELVVKGQISPEIGSKLDLFIEARHKLVHRWVQENGTIEDDDADAWERLASHASQVIVQAEELTRHLTGYLLKYTTPEWVKNNPHEHSFRINGLFRSPYPYDSVTSIASDLNE